MIDNTNWVRAAISNTTTTVNIDYSGSTINNNEWHHIVLVFDRDGDGVMYYDTNLVDNEDISGITSLNNIRPFVLGCAWNSVNCVGNYFVGYVDELKIFNFTLTSSQIKQIYNEESQGRNSQVLHSDEIQI